VLYKPIREGNFIARSFSFEEVNGELVVLAPLRYHSMLEAPQWNKTKDSEKEKRLTIDNTFRELRRHGKDFFEKVAPALHARSMEKYGYYSKYSDWVVVRDCYWEKRSNVYRFDSGEVSDFTPWYSNESIGVGLDSQHLLPNVF